MGNGTVGYLDISVAVLSGFSLVRNNLEVDGYKFLINNISPRIHPRLRDNL